MRSAAPPLRLGAEFGILGVEQQDADVWVGGNVVENQFLPTVIAFEQHANVGVVVLACSFVGSFADDFF